MVTFGILSSLIETRLRKPRTPEELKRLQARKLRKTMAYVTHKFDLRGLPSVLKKSDFVENFHKLNVLKMSYLESLMRAERGEPVGDIHFGLSTGTSGTRGVFMTSSSERARWAGSVLGRCIPNLLKRQRVAYFLRSDNKLYHAANRGRRIQLQHFNLDGSIDFATLNKYAPDIIMAPSYILARLALSDEMSFTPSLVISSADILDPWDEKVIRERFPRVHQIYQATEGFLAASCSHDSFHLNEDMLLFERRYLDDLHFVPIITDFHRRSQAIIRLELSDVIRLSKPCTCGSPFTTIERVDGRLDEIFQTPRKLMRGELAAAIAHLPLAGVDFRFTQKSANDFVLRVADEPAAHELLKALRAKLIEAGLPSPNIHIEPGFSLRLFEKRRRFVCEVPS